MTSAMQLPPVNHSVHRTMNETRERAATAACERLVNCECECHRAECGINFPVSIAAYHAIRALENQFVVAPAHLGKGESIVGNGSSYLVIEMASLIAV
jgi:hypothetical protein